jgi:hypothetical protein
MLLDIIKSAIKEILSSFDYQQEYGTTCTTLNGEEVKSKGEKIIADYLFRSNIRYEYEKPAFTRGWIFRDKISNPDFYLPEYDVFVEYWGLVNAYHHHVRSDYTKVMKWKMAQYHNNRIKFISIYPKNLDNLDWIFKAKLREVTGIDLTYGNRTSIHSSQRSPKEKNEILESKIIERLGKHYEKLELLHNKTDIRVRQKKWVEKEEWNEINRTLKSNGFSWLSDGKNSCWIKMNH